MSLKRAAVRQQEEGPLRTDESQYGDAVLLWGPTVYLECGNFCGRMSLRALIDLSPRKVNVSCIAIRQQTLMITGHREHRPYLPPSP